MRTAVTPTRVGNILRDMAGALAFVALLFVFLAPLLVVS